MYIRIGYDMRFELPAPVPMVLMLYTHPSRPTLPGCPDRLRTDPVLPLREFRDSFGNRGARLLAPAGPLRLWTDAVVEDDGRPDPVQPDAHQVPVDELPSDVLPFLLASRYCEVDLMAEL